MTYSTYLGGAGDDGALGVAVDSVNGVYLAGVTGSGFDFPIVGAAQPAFSEEEYLGQDAFVTKLTASGDAIAYSTFLGGAGQDRICSIAVDQEGAAYVVGDTQASDLAIVDAFQGAVGGSLEGLVAKIAASGESWEYLSYLGGASDDTVTAVALAPSGAVFVAGATASLNLPTTANAPQFESAGASEAFLARVREALPSPTFIAVSAASFLANSELPPESIASGFGTNLAVQAAVEMSVPLPRVLAGVSVVLIGPAGVEHEAPLFFVSESQINFLLPGGIAAGVARIEVRRDGEVVAAGSSRISAVGPSVFSADASGSGVAAAFSLRVAKDGTRRQEFVFDPATGAATPIDLGPEGDQIFLLLFGTGIRGFQAGVTATVGGESVTVLGAVPQGEFAGLDQVNLGPLPRSLAGRAEAEIILTADGKRANPVTATIR